MRNQAPSKILHGLMSIVNRQYFLANNEFYMTLFFVDIKKKIYIFFIIDRHLILIKCLAFLAFSLKTFNFNPEFHIQKSAKLKFFIFLAVVHFFTLQCTTCQWPLYTNSGTCATVREPLA